MSFLERQIAKAGFPKLRRTSTKFITPVHWSEFFTSKELIKVGPDDIFNVYKASNVSISKSYPVVIMIHGGGYSGLTWATTVKYMLEYMDAVAFAIDIRGHGETVTENDEDLSLATMASDIVKVLKGLGLEGHNLILIGHSLGGSLAIHVTKKINEELEMMVGALVVVDVVEGSALKALPNMNSVLRTRPLQFQSINAAIEWSLKSGHSRHRLSTRVSLPGQMKYTQSGKPCSLDVPKPGEEPVMETISDRRDMTTPTLISSPDIDGTIFEESEEDVVISDPAKEFEDALKKLSEVEKDQSNNCTWRVDLTRTDVFWQTWFEGISHMFLSITCPRLLILAGVDRLDKEMTIAQMQGKFQMVVVERVGHTVHEDDPKEVAANLAEFLVRNKLVNSKKGKEIQPSMPAW